MKHKPLPSQAYLHLILDYNPISGEFHHKYRYDRSAQWNVCYAGKRAGGISNKNYRWIWVDGKHYKASRLAWMYHYGVDPGENEIDHIDRMHDNDAIDNLRPATSSDQKVNFVRDTWLGHPVKRPYRGVQMTPGGRFRVKIKRDNKQIYLGSYDTPEEARDVYNRAAMEIHGEFVPAP